MNYLHNNMDEPQKDMLSQRSQTQKNIYSYDSVYMKFKNKQNESLVELGVGGRAGEGCLSQPQGTGGDRGVRSPQVVVTGSTR